MYSMGALSRSPSPITMLPAMWMASKALPHGVYGGLVGGLGVALTHGAGGGDGRLLDHVDKIAQQVSFNADVAWRRRSERS